MKIKYANIMVLQNIYLQNQGKCIVDVSQSYIEIEIKYCKNYNELNIL